MLKRLFPLLLFVLLFQFSAFCQQAKIDWKTKVVVNDRPGNYGSQYGRMLHLQNGNWLAAYTVSVNAGYQKDPRGGLQLEIAESKDGGLHWKKISRLGDPGRDVDNAALIQLSDGTVLLACRSVRWQESYRLPVYKSTDNGKSWKRISIIDANEGKPGALGHPDKGVYEPHFCFLKDGRLAVMYANEKHVTDSHSYSQIVSEKISSDKGKTWGKEIWVAYQPGDHSARPGMPVWTRMNNGQYMVVYEICGPQECNIYYKISKDGVHWPVGLGKPIPDQNGAPYLLSTTNGTLIVTSNKANISISNDFGEKWHQTSAPWELKEPYSSDWKQALWSALYQTDTNTICILTSRKRDSGGHNVQLRFGQIHMTGKQRVDSMCEKVVVTPDGKGFMLAKSHRTYHPWGMNYGHYGMLVKDFDDPVWDTLQSDVKKMKNMGANVVRIHVQYDQFMLSPKKPNPKAIAGYKRLLKIAKKTGLYLNITGLACYRPDKRVAWYDTLEVTKRWEAQAFFWRTIAKTTAGKPVVFCYDLVNEPIIPGDPHKIESWYTGRLGGYDFCQYLTFNQKGRTQNEIGYDWISKMDAAIKNFDKKTLITVGLFPWTGADFIDTIATKLDFMSMHIYPHENHIKDAMQLLQHFDTGKPVVIEEIFPMNCDISQLTDFMRESKSIATGWMGHYLASYSLKELEKMDQKTIKETLYYYWLSMFVRLKPEFAPDTINCN